MKPATDPSRPAGWVHHPDLKVLGPLDLSIPLPIATHDSLGQHAPTLDLVYADDGVYVPAVTLRPCARTPLPVVIVIHGGSGGLGAPYLVDHALNRGWALEAMLAHGYAVVLAEGRMEHEDAYGGGQPFALDHEDMIAVLRWAGRQPWADPARIGFFGVSHGGEMQMKLAAALRGRADVPVPAALVMCEPAVIEFLGLKYEGVRKEANLQFQHSLSDSQIDLARATERIGRLPGTLPMLVVGRDEDHLQGLFLKLHELLVCAGKRAEWTTYSHPEHAYQLGPRRSGDGYRPDVVQEATLASALRFLDAHVRDRP